MALATEAFPHHTTDTEEKIAVTLPVVLLCHLLLSLLPASLASRRALLAEVLPAQVLAAVHPRETQALVSAVPSPDFPAVGTPGWPSCSPPGPRSVPGDTAQSSP